MTDLHRGLRATLDADSSRYVERSPKGHVRQAVYNGRCTDAHGVEAEAQQKNDGTMLVTFSRFDGRTNRREALLTVTVPAPGEQWPFTAEERTKILDGTLTASPAAVARAEREQEATEHMPFFLEGICTECGLHAAVHSAMRLPSEDD